MKKTYTIKIDTKNIDNFDLNIEQMLESIKNDKTSNNQFEVKCLLDGFVENDNVNNIINTILHDVSNENSIFHKIFNQNNFSIFFKQFIKNLYKNNFTKDDDIEMEVFTNVDGKQFCFRVNVPDNILNGKYDEFINLGPDYLIANLSVEQIFEYVLPKMYKELCRHNLLNNIKYKDLNAYKIGLA